MVGLTLKNSEDITAGSSFVEGPLIAMECNERLQEERTF